MSAPLYPVDRGTLRAVQWLLPYLHLSKGEVKSHEDQRMKSYMGGGGGKPAPWKSGVGPVGVQAGTELGYGPDCRACERRCSPSGGDGMARVTAG